MRILLCLLLLMAAPAAADFKAGQDAYSRGDHKKALEEWEPLARQGNTLAQLHLGLMYERGHPGVPKDLQKALEWFEKAAASPGEYQKRAQAGRERVTRELARGVDPALVGVWQVSIADPVAGTTTELRLEITASGEYKLTTTKKKTGAGDFDSRVSEKGQFQAQGGKYTWISPINEIEGTYRIIDRNSVDIAGPLGTARWTRVGAPASPAAGGGTASSGRVLYEDDFRSRRNWNEYTAPPCTGMYGDGGYIFGHIGEGIPCWMHFRGAGEFGDNVRIELTARLRKGDSGRAFGLMFGWSATEYYAASAFGDGRFNLAWNRGGRWTQLISPTRNPAVRSGLGVTNRLAVEIQDRVVRLFVNDRQVGSIQVTSDPRGGVGFYLDESGMEAVFSDLRVIELAAPKAAQR